MSTSTELSRAISGGLFSLAIALLQEEPGVADAGSLSLALRARASPSMDADRLELIQALIAAYPASFWTACASGCHPLHIAIVERASMGIIQCLLDAHPEGARVRDANYSNRLPLHAAARENAEVGIIRALIRVYPAALAARDERGFFPLHAALSYAYVRLDVVEELLAAYPAAASTEDEEERVELPLRRSLGYSSRAVREAVFSAFPPAAHEAHMFRLTCRRLGRDILPDFAAAARSRRAPALLAWWRWRQ